MKKKRFWSNECCEIVTVWGHTGGGSKAKRYLLLLALMLTICSFQTERAGEGTAMSGSGKKTQVVLPCQGGRIWNAAPYLFGALHIVPLTSNQMPACNVKCLSDEPKESYHPTLLRHKAWNPLCFTCPAPNSRQTKLMTSGKNMEHVAAKEIFFFRSLWKPRKYSDYWISIHQMDRNVTSNKLWCSFISAGCVNRQRKASYAIFNQIKNLHLTGELCVSFSYCWSCIPKKVYNEFWFRQLQCYSFAQPENHSPLSPSHK